MQTQLKSSGIRVSWVQKVGPLLGLGVIVVALSLISRDFLSITNIFNVLRQISINALLAFGMTFVILTGGSTSPSVPFWLCPEPSAQGCWLRGWILSWPS